MARRTKGARETVEDELERLRLLQNFGQVEVLFRTQLRSPKEDAFSALVQGELYIEDYLYANGCNPNPNPPGELINAKNMLLGVYEGKISSKASNQKQNTVKLEASILLCKVCYLCDNLDEVNQYFDKEKLEELGQTTRNPRMLRLVAEAYSIKGLTCEKKGDGSFLDFYVKSAETSLLFLKISEQSQPASVHGNSPAIITHFLEYAVQRVPVLEVSNGKTQRGIDTIRKWLQTPEIRNSPELRALLAKQLAELLLRLVSDKSYKTVTPVEPSSALPHRNWSGLEPPHSSKSSSVGSSRGQLSNSKKNNSFSLSNNIFNPANRTEEVLLLLLVTECLISRDLVLDQSVEHQFLREKRVKEEKFVLDLLTIVLVKHAHYSLLTETVERGMKVAFNAVDMWYKFALCLVCCEKYARAITVLQECHNLQPDNPLFLSLTAKVALHNLNDAELGVQAASEALQLSADADDYERARVHMLLGVAYAMRAESLSITQLEKSSFLKQAMHNFQKANELDDNDPCIQFNYSLCLANTRDISRAKRILSDCDEHEPAQELSVLILTSEKKFTEALHLVNSFIGDRSHNLTMIYLKIVLEEKLYGPEVAIKTVLKLARIMNRAKVPIVTASDTVSQARSHDNMNTLTLYRMTPTGGAGGGLAAHGHSTMDLTEAAGSVRAMSARVENTLSDGASSIETSPQRVPFGGANTLGSEAQMRIWLLVFEFYLKMGKKELADESIQEAQQIYPSHHYVFYAQGLRKEFEAEQLSPAGRAEALKEAKQEYSKSLTVNPRGLDTRHKLAALLTSEGSLEMAEKLLRECLQVDPYHDKSWQLLGDVLMRRGDAEQASHSLMTACKLELTSPIQPFSSLLCWTF